MHLEIKKGSAFPVKISRLIEVNAPSSDLNDTAIKDHSDRVAEMLSSWSKDGYYVVELRMDCLLPNDKIFVCSDTSSPELVAFKEAASRVSLAPPGTLTFALFTAEDSPFHVANDAAYFPGCTEGAYNRNLRIKNHAEFIPGVSLRTLQTHLVC